jgi:hypothetical protein
LSNSPKHIDAKKRQKEYKAPEPTATDGGTRPCEALLVSEGQLVEHISMGWEVVKELSSDKVVIRKAAL